MWKTIAENLSQVIAAVYFIVGVRAVCERLSVLVEHSKNKIKLQLVASEILPEDSCYDDGPEEIVGRIDEAENTF